MQNSKIKLKKQEDFYNALTGVKETSDQLVEDSCKYEDSEVGDLVREQMDNFFKELATIASGNVYLTDDEPIDLRPFETEPLDQRLEDEALEMEKQMRQALDNVVGQRRNILGQLQPLAKEVVSHKASIDRVVFASDQNEEEGSRTIQDNEEQTVADRDTMLKEYQDALKMLPYLEKALVETKMETEQLNDVLKAGKHL
ncbi:hypothetical protein BDB00DRAFT_942236 [Zychaea mexicana]|uniref:uncharacterized protein n=1 Tax=Zychaea mexicana TaxID=64656 RepID=UPI0022FE2CE6|nr:uncharacterized protein BDB00DRAFT_942236 [Zychaea mexicana]KAI9488551.1 hypothetical protein BDB00DRAFT_942236 [Zychaea mexicana]